ncbi:MAG: efflux RND transporter permease subunit [Planctomycetaceae bacterium]|nr:efflux RND transporter permease subunit [Planctomycetaceae bacterium]
MTLHPVLFRQAAFIERAIGNLSMSLLIGCLLVTLILIAFLFQWRTVVISLTAIPLSLLGAILVLRLCGSSLNAMTLGGLAIALGEVVDDAIVDVENVLRRLRENARRDHPDRAFKVILNASLEVRSAVVYASFIVILVFLPVFFMGGLAGTFFRPLGLAYIAAILVSLLVALTVTPAMCFVFLRSSSVERERDPLLIRMLTGLYRLVLPVFLRFRSATVLASLAMMIAAAYALPFLGGEFLPDFRESNLVVFMAGKSDSSLQESVRVGGHLAEELQKIPDVLSVAQQIGRADLLEDTWGPNVSEVWIMIDDDADYDATLKEIRDLVEQIPGYQFQLKQFLRERIDEVLTGTKADIAIQVIGPELPLLRQKAVEISQAIEGVDGVDDLQVEQLVEVPQVEILLKPQQVAQFGFTIGQLNADVQTLLRGRKVGQVYEQDRVFDVIVRTSPEVRANPSMLGKLLVESPVGDRIPLKSVSQISIDSAPNLINREQASRRILVTCNAEGRDVVSVMEDIQRTIEEDVAELSPKYHLEYGGEFAERAQASQRLMLLSGATLVGIFLLLYLDFQSIRLTIMVMLSVPLACVGGVAAVRLAGGDISLGSMVGFVTIFGVAIRNGILLISHYQHLQQEESLPFGRELILRGAAERLAPILMTASSTALALLPLVILGNLPGHEIEHPMAIVIIGGLLSSTFLTLFLLPVLYEWFGKTNREFG